MWHRQQCVLLSMIAADNKIKELVISESHALSIIVDCFVDTVISTAGSTWLCMYLAESDLTLTTQMFPRRNDRWPHIGLIYIIQSWAPNVKYYYNYKDYVSYIITLTFLREHNLSVLYGNRCTSTFSNKIYLHSDIWRNL